MTMMESSPTMIAPLLLRNLVTSIFTYADKPLIFLAEKYKLLEVLRYFLVSSFLFFLRVLPSFFPSLIPPGENNNNYYSLRRPRHGEGESYNYNPQAATDGGGNGGDTGISRALSQLLSLVNCVPVSSRKYEVVRSLAEKLLDENLAEGNQKLREINCRVLSAAFRRTLRQLETAILDQCRGVGNGDVMDGKADDDRSYWLSRFFRGAKYYGEALWRRAKLRGHMSCKGSSAEKLVAELLWLAQKMTACGCADEAVCEWASFANLAWISLSAEPQLQGSLIKVSAFLFKQAKGMGSEEDEQERKDQIRITKMMMLMAWLPLLCRGSIGTDAPVLSSSERAELEKILEEIIETLEQAEEQEQVLSLWLHHFTYCASSDWPNLQKCYTRWCDASRKLLLLH